jgi:hypothetical protein
MSRTFDPDSTRRDDAAYWGAVLIMAARDGDKAREKKAVATLRRLGFVVSVAREAVTRG